MKNPTLMKFGKRVRQLRKSQKLSQQELASKAGNHYTWIGGVERGERNPTLQSIEKMAKGLGVKIGEFFPSQELSPEEKVIEKIVNLLRRKDLEVPQLVLKVVKVIVKEYHH